MAETMGHYRLASKVAGDDTTRARYVRTNHDETPDGRKRRVNRPRLPGFEASFIQEGRTKFSKSVQAPTKDILVSGHNNIKIGKVVTARFLKGYWIYTLSLEERKTCPSSCKHWQTCYGNNMPFAKRVDHTAPDFLEILEKAIVKLCAPRKPGRGGTVKRKGVLIRLHALGDFFSVPYVQFWARMLHEHPTLSIYGYTARKPVYPGGLGIGDAIQEMNAGFPGRSMIRFSDGGMSEMSTVSIGNPDSCPKDAFICPEQTGKSVGCDACGACWGTRKNVAFLEH